MSMAHADKMCIRDSHNIMGADKHALLLESLRVLKKGGVFGLHDNMKPQMDGDMNALVEKRKSMGFAEVLYVETAEAIFGSKQRAAMMTVSYTHLPIKGNIFSMYSPVCT